MNFQDIYSQLWKLKISLPTRHKFTVYKNMYDTEEIL